MYGNLPEIIFNLDDISLTVTDFIYLAYQINGRCINCNLQPPDLGRQHYFEKKNHTYLLI